MIFNYDYDYECNDDNHYLFYCHNLIINDRHRHHFFSNFKRIIVIHIIVIFENDCITNSKNELKQIKN